MKDVWANSVNAAATMWLQRTWTGPAGKTTVLTSAATMETVCVARVSVRREKTPRRGTAASTVSVTTSTVTALETNCVEVSMSATHRVKGCWKDLFNVHRMVFRKRKDF